MNHVSKSAVIIPLLTMAILRPLHGDFWGLVGCLYFGAFALAAVTAFSCKPCVVEEEE